MRTLCCYCDVTLKSYNNSAYFLLRGWCWMRPFLINKPTKLYQDIYLFWPMNNSSITCTQKSASVCLAYLTFWRYADVTELADGNCVKKFKTILNCDPMKRDSWHIEYILLNSNWPNTILILIACINRNTCQQRW